MSIKELIDITGDAQVVKLLVSKSRELKYNESEMLRYLKLLVERESNRISELMTIIAELRPYQIEAFYGILNILDYNDFYIDLSNPGAGKTYTACLLAKYLDLSLRVICPTLALELSWDTAIKTVGLTDARVISYDSLKSKSGGEGQWLKSIGGKGKGNYRYTKGKGFDDAFDGPVLFIVDEIQVVKGKGTQQSTAVKSLIKLVKKNAIENNYRYKMAMLSATPIGSSNDNIGEHCKSILYNLDIITDDMVTSDGKADKDSVTLVIEKVRELVNNRDRYFPDDTGILSSTINRIENDYKDDKYNNLYSGSVEKRMTAEFNGVVLDLFWDVIRDIVSVRMKHHHLPGVVVTKRNIFVSCGNENSRADKVDGFPNNEIAVRALLSGIHTKYKNEKGVHVAGDGKRISEDVKDDLKDILGGKIKSVDDERISPTDKDEGIKETTAKIIYECLLAIEVARIVHNDLKTIPNCKYVICCNALNAIDELATDLYDYGPLLMYSETSKEGREDMVRKFNAPNNKYRLLIMNVTIGGAAISLHDKSKGGRFPRKCIIFPEYSIIRTYQAGGRVDRTDMTSSVDISIVYHKLELLDELSTFLDYSEDKSRVLRRFIGLGVDTLLPGDYPTYLVDHKTLELVPASNSSIITYVDDLYFSVLDRNMDLVKYNITKIRNIDFNEMSSKELKVWYDKYINIRSLSVEDDNIGIILKPSNVDRIFANLIDENNKRSREF